MTRPSILPPLAILAAGLMLAGCARPQADAAADGATPASTAPPPAAAPPGDTAPGNTEPMYAFRIGPLEAVALHDGDIDVANDGKTFGIGQPQSAIDAVLASAQLPTDTLHLSIQPLLVRGDGRVMLFDTGAADASFARAGKLPQSLQAAGVAPGDVTDVFISHLHPDHVGGLLAKDGTPAFPNAAVHLSAPEWAAMQADTGLEKLVAAIRPKAKAFTPGAELIPGVVKAVADAGHTPGHSAYEIGSGKDRLLYIGDGAHHWAISVQRPDWVVQFDQDAERGRQARRALLQRAADEQLRVYAVHFPFPGLGVIEARGDTFVWLPEG